MAVERIYWDAADKFVGHYKLYGAAAGGTLYTDSGMTTEATADEAAHAFEMGALVSDGTNLYAVVQCTATDTLTTLGVLVDGSLVSFTAGTSAEG